MTATEWSRLDATQVQLALLLELIEETRDLLDDAVIDLRGHLVDAPEPPPVKPG